MKRTTALIILIIMSCTLIVSCSRKSVDLTLNTEQMRSICELAVMDCYYHTVAKVNENDAKKFLFWSKDKHFWIEYSAKAKLGIDMSAVGIDIARNNITITLPAATVLDCNVVPDSSEYYIDAGSVKPTSEDDIQAKSLAEKDLKEKISADKILLESARSRAKTLLENYINCVETAVEKEYSINWVYLD